MIMRDGWVCLIIISVLSSVSPVRGINRFQSPYINHDPRKDSDPIEINIV